MSEYLQENRRAVVLLAVAVCVAVLGGLYLLLSSGADGEELPPVDRGAPAETTVIEEPVSDIQPAVRVYAGRGTNANPFGPLTGSQDDASKSDSSTPSSPSASPTAKKSASTSKASATDTGSNPSGSTSGSTGTDPAPEPVASTEPQPIEPEPIDTGKDSQDAVLVKLVDIREDSVIARVDGERTTLYLNEPGKDAVIYVAPLGGGCAWMGRTDTEIRVSVCKGKAERV